MSSSSTTTTPSAAPSKPIILSPVRLLEKLSSQEQGSKENTPIPSSAMITFITGMQSINKNPKLAGEKLAKSLQEAEKSKVKEEIAVSQLGMGYYYTLSNEYDKAIQLYNESLKNWKSIHGENSLNLADLLLDIAKIYQIQNNEIEFKKTIDFYNNLFKINNKTPPKMN